MSKEERDRMKKREPRALTLTKFIQKYDFWDSQNMFC